MQLYSLQISWMKLYQRIFFAIWMKICITNSTWARKVLFWQQISIPTIYPFIWYTHIINDIFSNGEISFCFSQGWQQNLRLMNFPSNKFSSFLLSGHYFKRIESNKRDKISDECASIIFYDVALENFSYKNPRYWTIRNIKREDSDDNCNTNNHWMLGRVSANNWLWNYWKSYRR